MRAKANFSSVHSLQKKSTKARLLFSYRLTDYHTYSHSVYVTVVVQKMHLDLDQFVDVPCSLYMVHTMHISLSLSLSSHTSCVCTIMYADAYFRLRTYWQVDVVIHVILYSTM